MNREERRRRRVLVKRHTRRRRVTPEDVQEFRELTKDDQLAVMTNVLADGGSAGNISGVALLVSLAALIISAGGDDVDAIMPFLVLAVSVLVMLTLAVNSRMHNADNRARIYEKYLTQAAEPGHPTMGVSRQMDYRKVRRPVQTAPRTLRRRAQRK